MPSKQVEMRISGDHLHFATATANSDVEAVDEALRADEPCLSPWRNEAHGVEDASH